MDSKSHADLSRVIRPSSGNARRNSFSGDDNQQAGANKGDREERRTHYWTTIMGKTTAELDSSGRIISPIEQIIERNESSRNSAGIGGQTSNNINIPARIRPTSQIQIDIGHSSRPVRKQPFKPFQCSQCSRRFERRGHLKAHVDAVHELQQPYVCHFIRCQRTFSHQSSLNRHLKVVHNFYPSSERRSPKKTDKK